MREIAHRLKRTESTGRCSLELDEQITTLGRKEGHGRKFLFLQIGMAMKLVELAYEIDFKRLQKLSLNFVPKSQVIQREWAKEKRNSNMDNRKQLFFRQIFREICFQLLKR